MRAIATAAQVSPAKSSPPPPTYQEHEVTLRLHHHVYELAVWAFRYEQSDDAELAHLYQDRTFEEFLEGCIEEGLESTVARWQHTQA
jgi:hypothetical protein